jgi:hypothetical protein
MAQQERRIVRLKAVFGKRLSRLPAIQTKGVGMMFLLSLRSVPYPCEGADFP